MIIIIIIIIIVDRSITQQVRSGLPLQRFHSALLHHRNTEHRHPTGGNEVTKDDGGQERPHGHRYCCCCCCCWVFEDCWKEFVVSTSKVSSARVTSSSSVQEWKTTLKDFFCSICLCSRLNNSIRIITSADYLSKASHDQD